jgi:cytochrome P450
MKASGYTALPLLVCLSKQSLPRILTKVADLERVVPPEVTDLYIHGTRIPPGSLVATQAWTNHRDPTIFERPDDFWPERWLEETHPDSGRRAAMQQRYMPFGIGPRICVGQKCVALATQKGF